MSLYDALDNSISGIRKELLKHRMYDRLHSLRAMQVFMEYHIFAVWDFMSLLKALQRKLTCVDVPWRPVSNRSGCHLINAIVLGEESDADSRGGHASHYELYRSAMLEAGADPSRMDRTIEALSGTESVSAALELAGTPQAVRAFVETTFDIIDHGNLWEIASAFTFGREQLLPQVFQQIVDGLHHQNSGSLELFRFYLQRHIELDGDTHGPMTRQLMEEVCGADPLRWDAARNAALRSLEARRLLWDAVAGQIESVAAA